MSHPLLQEIGKNDTSGNYPAGDSVRMELRLMLHHC